MNCVLHNWACIISPISIAPFWAKSPLSGNLGTSHGLLSLGTAMRGPTWKRPCAASATLREARTDSTFTSESTPFYRLSWVCPTTPSPLCQRLWVRIYSDWILSLSLYLYIYIHIISHYLFGSMGGLDCSTAAFLQCSQLQAGNLRKRMFWKFPVAVFTCLVAHSEKPIANWTLCKWTMSSTKWNFIVLEKHNWCL